MAKAEEAEQLLYEEFNTRQRKVGEGTLFLLNNLRRQCPATSAKHHTHRERPSETKTLENKAPVCWYWDNRASFLCFSTFTAQVRSLYLINLCDTSNYQENGNSSTSAGRLPLHRDDESELEINSGLISLEQRTSGLVPVSHWLSRHGGSPASEMVTDELRKWHKVRPRLVTRVRPRRPSIFRLLGYITLHAFLFPFFKIKAKKSS